MPNINLIDLAMMFFQNIAIISLFFCSVVIISKSRGKAKEYREYLVGIGFFFYYMASLAV